jgi:hypothetical protein
MTEEEQAENETDHVHAETGALRCGFQFVPRARTTRPGARDIQLQ